MLVVVTTEQISKRTTYRAKKSKAQNHRLIVCMFGNFVGAQADNEQRENF
jgi:hypothetical protein